MKYIRTIDGIWLFGGTHHNRGVIIGKKHEHDFGYCFDKKDIIKQADTIKELCDEFVIIDKENKKQVMSGYGVINIKLFNESGYQLFGAIWTDKGLIYVAKMNEKGELELL